MSAGPPAYGLWSLVIINIAVFAIFAFSFTHPRTARDWRSFGGFTAFLVALFAEMYGFPLTIYLLSGWLQRRYPRLDLLSLTPGISGRRCWAGGETRTSTPCTCSATS
jgi:hypothetical protein